MEYDYIEEITNAGKTSYETLQKIGDINTKTLQQLAELQFDFAAYSIETGIEQSKRLADSNNYKDLLSVESGFAEEYSAKAMDFGKKAASILSETQEEIVSLVGKEFDKASKQTTKGAKAVTPEEPVVKTASKPAAKTTSKPAAKKTASKPAAKKSAS